MANRITRTRSSARVANSFTGISGAGGDGDRGAYQDVPLYSGNPHDSNNYIYRWKQYCHLYETSWEARKIVRIPVEDALRKPWELQEIPEQMATVMNKEMEKLNLVEIFSRSMMLERILGGCITLLGLESEIDDPSKPFFPRVTPARIRFMNAIPCSRIARIHWDSDPFSENYMRPRDYYINGQALHTSRAFVWDGQPLFDPMDYALTQYRSNLAGFGPSVLAAIWDDIKYAVGTRQAAYQMIQTNNSLIVMVKELVDMASTVPGKAQMETLKKIVNQISLYRAALIDKESVEVSQHSASFGSVPELIITYIQVLAAASDIPATRFLGQAPGGLNATGESDLENYYNMVDSIQHQRIEPKIRRICDIMGYQKWGELWHKERENLVVKFPPLWNIDEKEAAEKDAILLDNVFKAYDAGAISDEKLIEELNARKIFNVELDDKDLKLKSAFEAANPLADPNAPGTPPGTPGNGPGKPPEKPQGQRSFPVKGIAQAPKEPGNAEARKEIEKVKNSFGCVSPEVAILTGEQLGVDWSWFSPQALARGISVEMEHSDVTGGDLRSTAQIAIAHLRELADYYERLEMYVENASDEYKEGQEACKNGKLATDNPYSDFKKSDDWARGWESIHKKEMQKQSSVHKRLKQQNRYIPVDSVNRFPTDRQKSAGNYSMHHARIHGLEVTIENPQGTERSGTTPDGSTWHSILPAHYGYIRRTEGADGDHVDVFLGPIEEAEIACIIDQVNLDTQAFDEHKCVLGISSENQAREIYTSAFSDGRGADRIGSLSVVPIKEFKDWVRKGNTKLPFVNKGDFKEGDHPRADDGKFGSGSGSSSGEKEAPAGEPEKANKIERKRLAAKSREDVMKGHSPEDQAAHAAAKAAGIAIPPAWKDVWVNPDRGGDLLAKGKDSKGRQCYVYSANARAKKDAEKFARLKEFSQVQPKAVAQVEKDYDQHDEAKVIALIAKTGFRLGGEKNTQAEVQAFGASTLRTEHVSVEGDKVSFNFTGKKGVKQSHTVEDAALARHAESRKGEEKLFDTSPEKVRAYLKSIAGNQFKVKDFRTYVATSSALGIIKNVTPPTTEKERARAIMFVAREVSKKLGNTPEMARDSYIDPAVFKRWRVK